MQILLLSFRGPPPVCMVLFPYRLTAAGVGRGFSMCHSAKRTVRSGGRTARTTSHAKTTGTRAGTGRQVSGLCGESLSSSPQARPWDCPCSCLVLGAKTLPGLIFLWSCRPEGGQATTHHCCDAVISCEQAETGGLLSHMEGKR